MDCCFDGIEGPGDGQRMIVLTGIVYQVVLLSK